MDFSEKNKVRNFTMNFPHEDSLFVLRKFKENIYIYKLSLQHRVGFDGCLCKLSRTLFQVGYSHLIKHLLLM